LFDPFYDLAFSCIRQQRWSTNRQVTFLYAIDHRTNKHSRKESRNGQGTFTYAIDLIKWAERGKYEWGHSAEIAASTELTILVENIALWLGLGLG
jgi:hypothetical protein